MATVSNSGEVQPEGRTDTSTGVRRRAPIDPDATEETHVLSDFLVEEPPRPGHALQLPEPPPLPVSPNPSVGLQLELDRVTRISREQFSRIHELETMLARTSQELLETDEREAALVRRFHDHHVRVAELDRLVRAQNEKIEQLQAALPRRSSEASVLLSIRGIGPKYARALHALGVTSIVALAQLSDEDVSRVEKQLRIRNGRIRRERWIEQARELQSVAAMQ